MTSPASAKPQDPATDWSDFGRKVASAFDALHNVGGAVAVVSADQVLHMATFGVRNLQGRRPVTPSTLFRVGSTTKSMAAALVATYVDDGSIGWNQKVIDAWSGFRAPTDEMTRTLRVRDLLGMGSGIGEPARVESGLHFDGLTAAQIVESVVTLPVVAPRVDEKFFYANSIQTVGGYLPLLAAGVAPADLASAWDVAVRKRVFEPAGMTGARILGDPRARWRTTPPATRSTYAERWRRCRSRRWVPTVPPAGRWRASVTWRPGSSCSCAEAARSRVTRSCRRPTSPSATCRTSTYRPVCRVPCR